MVIPCPVSEDSGVGDHAGDLVMIRLGDKRRPAKLALGLGGLGGEDMAHLGLAPLELAGTRLFEALGRAAVCLQLWHWMFLVVWLVVLWDNPLSIPESVRGEANRCSRLSHHLVNAQRTPLGCDRNAELVCAHYPGY